MEVRICNHKDKEKNEMELKICEIYTILYKGTKNKYASAGVVIFLKQQWKAHVHLYI